MPLTDEAKILKIGKILKIDSIRLVAHLDYFESYFTAERNAQIDTALADWLLIKDDFSYIKPMESNKGYGENSDSSKQSAIEDLESLLLLEYADWYSSSGSVQIELSRG